MQATGERKVLMSGAWLDGKRTFRSYSCGIACSDGLAIGRQYRCDRLPGNAVDVAAAPCTNRLVDVLPMAQLSGADFNPKERAFRAENPDAALDRLRRTALQGHDAVKRRR